MTCAKHALAAPFIRRLQRVHWQKGRLFRLTPLARFQRTNACDVKTEDRTMSMKEELKAEMKVAMKARDRVRLDTIRSILSAIQYEEMQKGTEDLPADTIVAVLKNESKKRKESLEFSTQAGRTEEIEQLQVEIAVIDSFLPQQLSEAELEQIIKDLKTSEPDSNMGQIMKSLKDKYFGQYDGKLASDVAKRVAG
jgi:uncharacterized protein YqeY